MRLLRRLEKAGELNREVEDLPSDEVIEERAANGKGFTLPEMSVLIAYGKISLYKAIVESKIPDNPHLASTLVNYFPSDLHEIGAGVFEKHPLKREILATVIANDLVNRMGISFATEKAEKTGAPLEDVVRAYLVVRDIFGLDGIWKDLEDAEGKIPERLRLEATREVIRFVERVTRWFLNNAPRPFKISELIVQFKGQLETFQGELFQILPLSKKEKAAQLAKSYEDLGLSKKLSSLISSMDMVAAGPLIASLASTCSWPIKDIAELFFWIEQRFSIDNLREKGANFEVTSSWDKQAMTSMLEYLLHKQGEIAYSILKNSSTQQTHDEMIASWAQEKSVIIHNLDATLDEIRKSEVVSVSMLTVVSRQLRLLAK